MNLFDLTNKIAVVTGASSGLGVQFAEALAEAGADVAIVARRIDRLEALAEKINATGRTCRAYACDVAKEEDVCSTVEKIEADFGRIDILVNNAGVAIAGATTEYSLENWNKVLNVNINGVFLFSRETAKVMLKNNYGKIVNITSIAGLLGSAGNVSYNTSKAAVANMTRSLAAEFATQGITVNAIAPGVFESEMTEGFFDVVDDTAAGRTPMGRIGKTGELNGALIYLASDASSYTTGQVIAVDGGQTSLL